MIRTKKKLKLSGEEVFFGNCAVAGMIVLEEVSREVLVAVLYEARGGT